jgi:copper homeostasis protein
MKVFVEACVGSIEEALAAEEGGADRLELCDNLDVGGTTPNRALILEVKQRVSIPVAIMVRPRGGPFVFTLAEVDSMRRDMDMVRELGADAVVIGLLNTHGAIDAPHTRELVARADGTPVTVHRAFDGVSDQMAALDVLAEAGVSRVLTGGGPGSALDGVDTLRALVGRAGGRISIMAGGTVRAENVARIVRRSGVHEVHARCERDPQRIRGIVDALSRLNDLRDLAPSDYSRG